MPFFTDLALSARAKTARIASLGLLVAVLAGCASTPTTSPDTAEPKNTTSPGTAEPKNAASPNAAGPKNMASDGIVLTGNSGTIVATRTDAIPTGGAPTATARNTSSTTAQIVTYVDYLCAYCGQFDKTNSDLLQSLVSSGAATLEIHPIAILDQASSGTNYSQRAASAAGCVAEAAPDRFFAFSTALFAQQPSEYSTGLTDAQLTDLAAESGAENVADCITSHRFARWVVDATQRAINGPLPNSNIPRLRGTPTIIVNGKQYTGPLNSVTQFKAYIDQVRSSSGG
ncbi:MAG: hypothetical protein B5766_05855 [Candidatus Lumbricidophila eiseniae]|uniref:Thioredoxin-like fold domain-containing protein n=1 Tax=Candidatus Lumbricidiphila eiseniae TaxID=1969409 RepID=A0A2A6FRV2_9MICO|nr:MAG: hypothetical protein B5766_05855 [Candidatus Lumbricidophila eiseniae]